MATGQRVYKKMCEAKANNEPARVDRYHATVKVKAKPNKTSTLSNEALAGRKLKEAKAAYAAIMHQTTDD